MNYPNCLKNLIESFKKLPGVGEKTAERYSYAIINNFEKEDSQFFSKSIQDVKEKLRKCDKCNNITESSICELCSDKRRNKKVICLVQDSKDIILFEKIGFFNGLYYVIEKLISPINGVGPEDINLEKLFKRIEDEKIEEVIIAIKPTIEGETTSLYIARMLEKKDVIVSKIAHGIPIGTDMEYLDPLTLELAIKDRKTF
ncbi:MAG: recombination mediator RecR [Bacilli bacterium]|nr:recombination mediator RecR [Bacilli bacterium]